MKVIMILKSNYDPETKKNSSHGNISLGKLAILFAKSNSHFQKLRRFIKYHKRP